MARLHQHVQRTRGAAAGLCAIDAAEGRVVYAGTGNTVLRRFGKIDTRLVSHDGVLGQNVRTPGLQTLQLEKGDLVVLYTDGVSDRFTSEEYPGIFHHAPKDVVRTIIERFGKDYDDAACIAVRYNG
jgi:serine/threonine protein phosphatase PrpC